MNFYIVRNHHRKFWPHQKKFTYKVHSQNLGAQNKKFVILILYLSIMYVWISYLGIDNISFNSPKIKANFSKVKMNTYFKLENPKIFYIL